jgi:hypothetical protein
MERNNDVEVSVIHYNGKELPIKRGNKLTVKTLYALFQADVLNHFQILASQEIKICIRMKKQMKTFLKLLPEATKRNANIYTTGLNISLPMCCVRGRPCDF